MTRDVTSSKRMGHLGRSLRKQSAAGAPDQIQPSDSKSVPAAAGRRPYPWESPARDGTSREWRRRR
jgi:hypothetical protein